MICIKFRTLEEIIEELKSQGIPETTEADISWAEFDVFMSRRHKNDISPTKPKTKDKY